MSLTTKSVAWHAGSMAAGAWGMLVFAQSHAVDVYAIVSQMKQTWKDLVLLSGMLAPFLAAGGAAYRTWKMRQVPKDAVAILPLPGNPPVGGLVAVPENHAVVTLPGADAPTVAKIVSIALAALVLSALLAAPSYAQTAAQRAAQRNDVNAPGRAVVGALAPAPDSFDLGGFKITDILIQKILPDLRYAAALSKQNNNKVTQPCLVAVLALVDSWQTEVKDDKGNVLALPEPHVITFLEKQSQLLRQLQSDSDISIGCGAMAQALRKDILSLVGALLSGGSLGLLPKIPFPIP